MTAMALARTLAEIAPNHPLTNHLTVAYWKGGDENIEQQLFRPEHIERLLLGVVLVRLNISLSLSSLVWK